MLAESDRALQATFSVQYCTTQYYEVSKGMLARTHVMQSDSCLGESKTRVSAWCSMLMHVQLCSQWLQAHDTSHPSGVAALA